MSEPLGFLFTAATSGKYLSLFPAAVKKEWCPVSQMAYLLGELKSKNHLDLAHLTGSADH
jgi:hypothetical protein